LPLKIDLHVHTWYSYDSLINLKELVFYAKKRGLDGVAITDHDTIEGVIKMTKQTDFLIIPGIEVSSSKGHILGLNVQTPIPPNLSVEETVEEIHEAGGLAVACHPKAFFKGSLGKYVNSQFDAVEVINSAALPFNRSIQYSRKLASVLGIPQIAGSDAHYAPEIGYAYTLIDTEPNIDMIIKAISKGFCQPFGNPIPLKYRLKREFLKLKKRF
jgi:hypothetical protein